MLTPIEATGDPDTEPWMRGGDDYMTVHRSDKEVGYGPTGRIYDLAYDTSEPNPDGGVCNALCTNGSVCRLPRGHLADGYAHMEFDCNLIQISGIYVLAIHEPGTVSP